jgi:MFS transporter, YNFM family, putative membrane transport protein
MFSDPRQLGVALGGVTSFFNLYAPQAALPLLAQEFGASPAEIAMIMTATALAVAVMAPFAGSLSDVLGRKRMITVALIAVLIPAVMLGFAESLQALIFWRFVQGLALPAIFVVTLAYVGDEWPAAQATAVTGLYVSGCTLGGFAGRLLIGIFTDAIGWRGAFLITAAMTAVFAVAMILLLPREKKFVRAANLGASLLQMLRHLKNPRLVATFAVGFGVLFSFLAFFTYVSFLLAAPPYNLSPTILGLLFVVYLLGTSTTPFTGRLIARFGRRQFILGIIGLWIFGTLLTLAPSLPVILLGLVIFPTCGFFVQAASTSYVATTAKEGVSAAVGLYVGFFYAGGSVGAYLPGLAWQVGGWPATVGMILAMLIVMAAIIATAWKPSSAK